MFGFGPRFLIFFMIDLSIITVTWNSEDKIAELIKSVRSGCKKISFEHFVVDNASIDQTVAVVEKDFPEVKIIRNLSNAGFAAANNQAAILARGDFFLFLNPDMRVVPDSLDKMMDWIKQHPEIGLAGCKLTDVGGKFNIEACPRRFPGLFDQLAIILKLPYFFPRILNRYLFADFDAEKEQPVDSIRGSFMLMRREIYEKLGWAFDSRYFIWFEDVDLCREVWKMGLKVFYTPVISCVDYVGQSFRQQKTAFWKQVNFTRSLMFYFKKWEPWYKWVWIAVARPVGVLLAGLGNFFNLK